MDYTNLNKSLQTSLKSYNVIMSSPIRLNSIDLIEQYCLPLVAQMEHTPISFCTSTELKDENGKFVGNIHMLGSLKSPGLILAAIQTGISENELYKVNELFNAVLKIVVCDCWNEMQPLGYTLDSFIEQLYYNHTTSSAIQTKSKIIELEGRKIQFILTTDNQNYEWLLRIGLL